MNVILSIKPCYVDEIVAGRKSYEFRKKAFKQKVDKVYVYASSPVCRIIGEFSLGMVHVGKPAEIWSKTRLQAGMSKSAFSRYYSNKTLAYALEIKNFKLYGEPIDPRDCIEGFVPPQSYRYIETTELIKQ